MNHIKDQTIVLSALRIYEIADLIENHWTNLSYCAKPYVDAMKQMKEHTDGFGVDSGRMIIAYFLSNATGWRGDHARAIKKELNKRIKW